MARKFNNGQRLGDIRDILNGNADEINNKVDKIPGKGLSSNDYTNDDKAKLQALSSGSSGGTVDLSGYQPKEDGKSLVPDTEIDKLSQINPANLVFKDGNKVLSDVNYTQTKDNKLGGISYNATKNSTDATLLARANHTGSQEISTITNLQSNLDSRPPTTPGSPVKPTGVWYGTQAEYDALPTKTVTFKYEIYEA